MTPRPLVHGALLSVLVGCANRQPAPSTAEAPARSESWQPAPLPADDSVYFVLVDRFANGAPDRHPVDPSDPQGWHGGDIQGVLQHLDHIQDLGYRTVWLSPVFDCRDDPFFEWGAFHGYWVEDLSRVDPRFGTEADLRALSDALHERDMRLVLDMVFNHVAMDAPLTREHPEWFHDEGGIEDWEDPHQLVHGEVHGLPDLAQERPPVHAYLRDQALSWVDRVHPDGYRIDAVRHMPLSFLHRLSGELEDHAGRGFLYLGEDFQGDPVGLARTFEQGGFDALFDFPLHYAMLDVFCHDRPVGRLAAILSADRIYPHPEHLVTFLDNHDRPRVLTECGGEVERVRQALAFQFANRGIPSLTYGTESGLEGGEEPANRDDMVFDADHVLESHIRRLSRIRSETSALHAGHTRLLLLDDSLLVLARVSPASEVLVGVNRSGEPRSPELPVKGSEDLSWEDLLTGEAMSDPSFPAGEVSVLAARPRSDEARARLRSWLAAPAGDRTVRLEVAMEPPASGESVLLVGTGPRLSNWNPAEGAGPFAWAQGVGSLEVEYPVGGVMEYKLVRRDRDGNVEWQEGDNRYLLVPPGEGPLTVRTSW